MRRKRFIFCILQEVNNVLQTDDVDDLDAVGLLKLLNCRRFAKTSFLAIHGNCNAGELSSCRLNDLYGLADGCSRGNHIINDEHPPG